MYLWSVWRNFSYRRKDCFFLTRLLNQDFLPSRLRMGSFLGTRRFLLISFFSKSRSINLFTLTTTLVNSSNVKTELFHKVISILSIADNFLKLCNTHYWQKYVNSLHCPKLKYWKYGLLAAFTAEKMTRFSSYTGQNSDSSSCLIWLRRQYQVENWKHLTNRWHLHVNVLSSQTIPIYLNQTLGIYSDYVTIHTKSDILLGSIRGENRLLNGQGGCKSSMCQWYYAVKW